MENVNIRDKETGQATNWSEIFFSLHKHCGLNKWEIWEYTLPQIAELMKSTSKFIQFEVETRMSPFSILGSNLTTSNPTTSENTPGEYEVATEDDLMQLGKILGGGM